MGAELVQLFPGMDAYFRAVSRRFRQECFLGTMFPHAAQKCDIIKFAQRLLCILTSAPPAGASMLRHRHSPF